VNHGDRGKGWHEMDTRRRSVERTLDVGPECRLHVENRSGRVVVLVAASTFGGVHSDFAVKDSQAAPPETAPSVRLRTTHGSIYLRSRAVA